MPAMSIEQLVAVNAYNPEVLPDLEQYVREEISQQTYNLDANLTLLRIYQFEPQKTNIKTVAHVLAKALMQLPARDFSLCMFLIPERTQREEPIAILANLGSLLETARFGEFWNEAARNRDLVESIPGFEEAIQRYAINVLAMSYQRVPRNILAEAVNINGPSLDRFLDQQKVQSGWSWSAGGEVIEFPANEDNHPDLRRNVADGIPLELVSKLFPLLA